MVGKEGVGSVRVACDPAWVASARSALVSSLARRGGVTPERRDDAALVLSELLGNAMRHAAPLPDGTFLVRWAVADDKLQVSVSDGRGPSEPRHVDAPELSTGGRGLAIVDALAHRWWHETRGPVRTVHAELRL
jgi:anti-sigma regulatory factor (Ser/Thr protein kinase)